MAEAVLMTSAEPHVSSILGDINSILREDKTFSNVRLVGSDGLYTVASGLLLASVSPLLRLLGSNHQYLLEQDLTILLPDFTTSKIEAFIRQITSDQGPEEGTALAQEFREVLDLFSKPIKNPPTNDLDRFFEDVLKHDPDILGDVQVKQEKADEDLKPAELSRKTRNVYHDRNGYAKVEPFVEEDGDDLSSDPDFILNDEENKALSAKKRRVCRSKDCSIGKRNAKIVKQEEISADNDSQATKRPRLAPEGRHQLHIKRN